MFAIDFPIEIAKYFQSSSLNLDCLNWFDFVELKFIRLCLHHSPIGTFASVCHQRSPDLSLLVWYLCANHCIHASVCWHINGTASDWLDLHALDQLNAVVAAINRKIKRFILPNLLANQFGIRTVSYLLLCLSWLRLLLWCWLCRLQLLRWIWIVWLCVGAGLRWDCTAMHR